MLLLFEDPISRLISDISDGRMIEVECLPHFSSTRDIGVHDAASKVLRESFS
jgi:hypothetical protein